MAMYEYRCVKCGASFEKIIRSAEQTKRLACPTCGSRRVKKQLSRFACHTGAGGSVYESSEVGCGCGGNCACSASRSRSA